MKSVLAHGTPEAYAMLFGLQFLIAVTTYFIGAKFFFAEFFEDLKEKYPNNYLDDPFVVICALVLFPLYPSGTYIVIPSKIERHDTYTRSHD